MHFSTIVTVFSISLALWSSGQGLFLQGPSKLAQNTIRFKAQAGNTLVNVATQAGSTVVNGAAGLASTGLGVIGSVGGRIPLVGGVVRGGVIASKKGVSAVQSLSLAGLSTVRGVSNAGFNALSQVG